MEKNQNNNYGISMMTYSLRFNNSPTIVDL